MYLEKINNPEDVKKLDATGCQGLVDEIRAALLSRASKHGGHFGPNFGMVEATVALHTVFDSPHDHIVYDVSHQTYPHKMLTGRKEAFTDPEHYDDVSPYTDPDETPHDLFKIGHTSTSISLALGLAKARDLRGGHENIVAVIGDGSMSGGEALEGLNVAGELNSNFIVVFNDNQRSIAENHGGMYDRFRELRESNGTAPNNLFKAMGLDYVYVNNGNDTEALIAAFKQVKDIDHPIVVHINTLKGKGYEPALKDEEAWHWHGPFDITTGQSLSDGPAPESYANLAGEYLLKRAETDENLLVVVSAVPFALGMSPERRERMGKHYLDVGIAEETAVAITSGAAHAGAHVVWGSSTTFQQRIYDQLSQDLALNGNPAVIVGNSGSVWGMSDVTHASFWTIPMIANIPNIIYLAPTNAEEYLAMLHWGLDQEKHPVFIQVPGGPVRHAKGPVRKSYDDLRSEVVRRGSKIAIFGLGSLFNMGEKTADILRESLGFEVTLVNPLFASGLDSELLDNLAVNHDIFVTLEDGQLEGGWGQTLASYFGNSDKHVLNYGIKKGFYDRFKADTLLHENRLEAGLIVADIRAALRRCAN